ncbi:radial spoke head protein 3 homolog B-like [Pollicipes pollicipes]|uniref:radial spoke head protein 3 homolog B-like n=1 Tax=Pollicipes pollicipes TaxID=41117 RepID=UPI001884C67E|nr:radial spoke head protein 3 homolog B-like [Pollicipes pollicipes]
MARLPETTTQLDEGAADGDSVFSAGETADTAGQDGDQLEAEPARLRCHQRRPPSRVSLVYTYASGPKVLSHVELAPETEGERQPSAREDGEPTPRPDSADDKLNGKHVTFEEDVKAASSVRIRRRRTGQEDEADEDSNQWKEIRKKNKERRKNRVSNSFRDVLRPVSSWKSSSTSGSLMNDKRLIKTGNIGTLVLHGQPQGGPSLTDIIRYQEARRRDAGLTGSMSRRGPVSSRRRDERVRTPPAVAGRKHYRVQTEPYLEEIRDRRVEADVAVQTDPMIDRPGTPLFVPSKTGADVATQIYEGDLFDFDLESAPILEVLVGKTVEQSLLEVMEEEELESLREHQRRFQEQRQAEAAEQQRLGERERRHTEEKDRRMAQRRVALEQEEETGAKVAASALAQSYLADMVPAVFSNLRQKGFFFNGVERDIETAFMPWLRDAVEQELDKVLSGKEVLDDLILDAVRKRREELERRPSLTSRLPPPASPPAQSDDTEAREDGEAGEEAEEDEEEEGEDLAEEEAEEDGGEEDDTDDEAPPPTASGSATKTGEEVTPEQDEDDP